MPIDGCIFLIWINNPKSNTSIIELIFTGNNVSHMNSYCGACGRIYIVLVLLDVLFIKALKLGFWRWSEDMLLKTYDDVIKWNHFPRYWPVVRGIHRSPVNSPHKSQWRGALFFFICAWIYGWVNNGEVGDLRRLRVHYDVTVMTTRLILCAGNVVLASYKTSVKIAGFHLYQNPCHWTGTRFQPIPCFCFVLFCFVVLGGGGGGLLFSVSILYNKPSQTGDEVWYCVRRRRYWRID